MNTRLIVLGMALLASFAVAQKPKSKAELEAVNAFIAATSPDDKIAKVEALLSKYKDTEFKSVALAQAADASQAKGDNIAALTYGNRALDADPKNFQALLLVSTVLVQTTREFDLDKDEKLKRSSKLANDALATVKTAAKPNPQLPDAQWADIKKDLGAQAHEILGMVAMVDKKPDAAIAEFQTSLDTGTTQEPATMIRLASAYNSASKFNEAATMADKVIATAGVSEAVKKFAQAEKQRAEKGKTGK